MTEPIDVSLTLAYQPMCKPWWFLFEVRQSRRYEGGRTPSETFHDDVIKQPGLCVFVAPSVCS